VRHRLIVLGVALACLSAVLFAAFASNVSAVVASPVVWGVQDSGGDEYLEGVEFVDATTGWVVGDNGTILKTADGGVTWTAQISGTSQDLRGVDFADALYGWAVGSGGTVVRTADGGVTWTPQTASAYTVEDIECLSGTTALAVGNGGVFKTTDGGTTWTHETEGLADAYWLTDVAFVGLENGWAVGWDGGVYRTADGGVSWAKQASGVTDDLESVCFVDASHGWAVGDYGTVLRTTDGGTTWSPQYAGTSGDLMSVCFTDTANGWAAGDDGIVRTANGGSSWVAETGPDVDFVRGLTFVSGFSGWAVGWGGLILHSGKPVQLAVSVKPTLVAYNGLVTIKGSLKTPLGALLPGRAMVLQRSADRSSWQNVRTLSSSTGNYSTTLRIVRRTYFRLWFAGDAVYGVGRSVAVRATSRALLGAPAVPSPVYKYRTYTCYGTLRPHHEEGWSPTVVYCYAWGDGRWQFLFSKSAESRDYGSYTRYRFQFRLVGTGTWTCRIRAVHADADHARTVSAWRTFTVR
jgi:photosystem II stability/assembly factor-like uncharacterized protein